MGLLKLGLGEKSIKGLLYLNLAERLPKASLPRS